MADLHPLNRQMRQHLLNAPPSLCMERARDYTHVHRANPGAHPAWLASHALSHHFAHRSIRIEAQELLVGNRASVPIAPPFAPERGDLNFVFENLWPDLQRLGYQISPSHRQWLFHDILPFWKGKTVRDHKCNALTRAHLSSALQWGPAAWARRWRAFGPRVLQQIFVEPQPHANLLQSARATARFLTQLPMYLGALGAGARDNLKGRGRCTDAQAHIVVGHKKVLREGFGGIHQQATMALASATNTDEQAFLQAVQTVCQAMRDSSERFAVLAAAQAATTPEKARRLELLDLAERCRRVPWEPPQSFHDALQALWFTQNAAIISYGAGSGITPGRVDQLLWPFYSADIAAQRITVEHARRLVEEFIIKLNDNVIIWPNLGGVRLNHLGSDVQNITLGGTDVHGADAVNPLTYLFIEALETTNLATTASFRIAPQTRREFVERVVEVHKRTNSPAFINDTTAVSALCRDGMPLAAARDYCLVGCVEPQGHGDSFGATGGSKVYFPTALDMALHRGRSAFFGGQDGPDTGNPEGFATFEALVAACFTQLEHLVTCVSHATNLRDAIWAQRFPNPLISSTVDGCVERHKDMTAGGALYNRGAIGGAGLATLVDSLVAMRVHVYQTGRISMRRLLAGLESNFAKDPALRTLVADSPRFGNDDDAADDLAAMVVQRFCTMVSAQRSCLGGPFAASLISYGLNVFEGALEPATPNGRGAGQPLSNSMSPSNGAEQQGPTAMLNSLAKIDQTRIGYGNSVNMKFPLALLNSTKGTRTVGQLVRTYFANGGFHIQLNVVDRQTLVAAQHNPTAYADLIVRVSGYSAYFTRLGREIQDDIIARTELAPCN